MNQSCPECGSADENFVCNFCGNKPKFALTAEMLEKAGRKSNEEQRKIFYKDQDPYEAQQKELLDEYADIKRVVDNCGMKDCNMCVEDKQEMKRLQGEIDRLAKVRVHHPVQPKTQVEKWKEERQKNLDEIMNCNKGKIVNGVHMCEKEGTDNCYERLKKMEELDSKIEVATQPIHPRYPTGEFADDKCNCAEISCKVGCKRNHTHKTFSCEKCNPKVTLLDKIKKLLWKYLEK